jgi:hypothetical protein
MSSRDLFAATANPPYLPTASPAFSADVIWPPKTRRQSIYFQSSSKRVRISLKTIMIKRPHFHTHAHSSAASPLFAALTQTYTWGMGTPRSHETAPSVQRFSLSAIARGAYERKMKPIRAGNSRAL